MRLEGISIRRIGYGPKEGQLCGDITVSGQTGKMTINLTPERAKEVVNLVADCLVDTANEAAAIVKSDLIEGHALIEGAE